MPTDAAGISFSSAATDPDSSSEGSTEMQGPADLENYVYESSHSTELSEIRRQILAPVLLNHQEEQIKKIGLIALKASDDAYLANKNEDGHIYQEVGKAMADLITDFIPLTSVPKDLYRLILGKDLLTGRDLEPWERTLAAVGVVTIGAGGIVANVARDALNIAKKFGTEARVAEEILRPRGFPNILSKIDNKVVTYSAEEINSTIHSAKLPPYKPGTRVYEITTKEPVTGVFARVYNNEAYKTGDWIVEKGLIDGKSPREIKEILALPTEPTHIVDVDLPAELTLRKGVLNKNFGSTGEKATLQYEIAEEKMSDPKSLVNYFNNPRRINLHESGN
jgi:hypothetical protein